MATFDPIFDTTLNHEGGFQQMPNDTANYVNGRLIGTNRGISALAYFDYYKRVPSVADMQTLSKEQAKNIYNKNYWQKINGDKIANQSVANLMFLFIINSGASQLSDLKDIANMVAGRKVLLSNDNRLTDTEIAFINTLHQEDYFKALKSWRFNFYNNLVKRSPGKKVFLKGWLNRLNKHTFVPSASDNSGSKAPVFFLILTSLIIWKRKPIMQRIKELANKK